MPRSKQVRGRPKHAKASKAEAAHHASDMLRETRERNQMPEPTRHRQEMVDRSMGLIDRVRETLKDCVCPDLGTYSAFAYEISEIDISASRQAKQLADALLVQIEHCFIRTHAVKVRCQIMEGVCEHRFTQ